MASSQRNQATRANIRKAQEAWRRMSSRARARAQPEHRRRAKPGARGGGQFFHIEVRPRKEFSTFRTHDVGDSGGIERVAGKRKSGSWATQKWLISKDVAHVERGRLVPDSDDARQVLEKLGAPPVHVSGDRFKAKNRPNVPERAKPTPAQSRAQSSNLRKAQAARRKR